MMMRHYLELIARRLRLTGIGALALAAIASPSSMDAQGVVPSRITATIDNSSLTTLRGGTPPLVARSVDHGSLISSTPATNMVLVLKRSDAQQIALDKTLSAMQTKGSPSYHKWLTPAQFSSQFGVSDADMAAVSTWLTDQGFWILKLAKGHTAIEFSGTVGQLSAAFHTEIHAFTAPDGTLFHANSTDPKIPTALSPVVAGLAAVNNIPLQSFMHKSGTVSYNAATHTAKPIPGGQASPEWSYPVAGAGVYLVTAPGDLAVQYDINPIYSAGTDGTGETIGIVSQAGVDNSIILNYRKLFGLSTTNLPTVVVDGFDPGVDGDGAGIEAALDAEVSGSTAPNASLILYTSSDSQVSLGLFNAAIRAVDDNTADVISVSYGICEPTLGLAGNLLFNQIWAQAAAQGQTVVVASGDSGSGGCDNGQPSATHGLAVNGMTSTPYNLSVGGTDFYYGAYGSSGLSATLANYWNTKGTAAPATSLLKTIPEQPWNDAFGFNAGSPFTTGTTSAGSGGASNCASGASAPADGGYTDSHTSCSAGTPKPAWQNAPGVPKDGVRDVPDISLFASNGPNYSFYPMCYAPGDCTAATADPTTGAIQITGVGGTSAATPLMAGIVALIDQSLHGRQGNVNPVLYSLANSTPAVFHDVTVGSNNVNCTENTPDCALDANGFYSYSAYSAGVGYDLASGLGSIDAFALLTNWPKASFKPTLTSLSVSKLSFSHGTPVTLTSVVSPDTGSGTPTGNVALVSTSTSTTQSSIGTLGLTNGTAEGTLTSLPAGTYQLTAEYGGDVNFAASTSNPVNLTVTPEGSSIAISGKYIGVTSTGDNAPAAPTSNGMTAPYGSFFAIDAKVFGASSTAANPDGIPTGVVTVLDNGQAITTLNLADNGVVELETGSLGAGKHALTFAYGGDGSFNAVTSAPYTINITKGAAQVLIYFGMPSGLPAGGTLTVPVEVTSAAGQLPLTGAITITFGSQTQTVQTLQQQSFDGLSALGTASVTFDISKPGTYSLNGSYSGDANLNPVATAYNPSTVTIYASSLQKTTTLLTTSLNAVGANSSGTATVKVTGGATPASGFVQLVQGANLTGGGSALDDTGTAILPISSNTFLSSGNIQLSAIYYGDFYHAASISNSVTVAVNTGDYSLNVAKPLLSITAGTSGTTMIAVASPYGQRLAGTVALSCSVSSPVLGCSLGQSGLTLPSDPTQIAATTLTITSQAGTTANLNHGKTAPVFSKTIESSLALIVVGVIVPGKRRRRILGLLAVAFLTVVPLSTAGCGHSYSTNQAPPVNTPSPNAGNYTAMVTANSSGITKTLVIRVVLK